MLWTCTWTDSIWPVVDRHGQWEHRICDTGGPYQLIRSIVKPVFRRFWQIINYQLHVLSKLHFCGYRIAGKFGGLAVYLYNHQIKIRQYFLLACMHMAIPYRIAKFKSANICVMAILGPTAKFNSCQYFWLYSSRTIMAVKFQLASIASTVYSLYSLTFTYLDICEGSGPREFR